MKTRLTIAALAAMSVVGAQATMTTELLVNFDGSIAGNTYTLGAGEIDTTGTFAGFGAPTVAAGETDLAGNGTHQGFNIDPTSIGTLTATHWIAETIVSFDAFTGGQLTAIDVQGDTHIRINNGASALEATYWDGSSGGNVSGALPSIGTPVHLAIVWDPTLTSLTAYVDGTSIGTLDQGVMETPAADNLSFGYFGRFDDRGIDGQLDSVSFATSDVAITTDNFVIPEPATFGLVGIFGGGLLFIRRKLMI